MFYNCMTGKFTYYCVFLQHDAQMDYYGTKLATCSSDRSLKIFDVQSGQQTLLADLRGWVSLDHKIIAIMTATVMLLMS